MSSGPPGDEQQPPQWQQPEQQPPQWQQPQSQPPQWGEQPPQQQQWGQQQQPQWQPPAATPGIAIASLILGIIGLLGSFCFIGIPCAIAALITGYKARSSIDASGGRVGGRGLAIAGIVLGWIGIALNALFIILIIVGATSSPA
jgi:hypothetical protein